MKFVCSFVLVCIYLQLTVCSGEIYSSVVHIQESVTASRKLAEDLITLARRENIHIPRIQQMHRQLKGKTHIIKKDPEHLISHPIRVFRFVRDVYNFFNETYHKVFKQTYAEDLINDLPTKTDLSGTISGLLRLQEVYNQGTTQVSHGIVASVPSFTLTGFIFGLTLLILYY